MCLGYFFYLLCISTIVSASPGDRLIVNTPDGDLSGLEGVTEDGNRTFWVFQGIPYAAPPIGKLRFKEPQPVQPWGGVRDASYERSICTQNQNPVQGSEDCLFLNVFTTVKPGDSLDVKPVMFWIHGGGFIFGSGNLGQHGADRFLDNDVIIVSINYRLGVFGFLCTLDEASPGNYGLKDQIYALKWVNRNIHLFGGDPKQVTIFGESAGSASVNYLLQSSLTKDLYWAAIAESGASINSWAVAQSPRALAFRVGATNLILTFDANYLVNGLRRINYAQLQNSATGVTFDLRENWNGLPWSPCLESNPNNSVVNSYNWVQLKYGDFVQVPVMEGFNSNEAREFTNIQWLSTFYSIQFSLIPEMLVPNDMNSVNRSGAASEIKAFYFNNGPVQNNSDFTHYGSDTLFVRGIRKSAEFHSKYVPTYLYRFSFTGGVTHRNFTPEGASHAEELQFLFNLNYTKQVTPAAILTQNRMLKLWTNFAKYRNPTPLPDPLLNVTWPMVDKNTGDINYLDIGTDLIASINPEEEEMTFWDHLYDTYGLQPFNAY